MDISDASKHAKGWTLPQFEVAIAETLAAARSCGGKSAGAPEESSPNWVRSAGKQGGGT